MRPTGDLHERPEWTQHAQIQGISSDACHQELLPWAFSSLSKSFIGEIFGFVYIRAAVARTSAGNPKALARAAVETLRRAVDGGSP